MLLKVGDQSRSMRMLDMELDRSPLSASRTSRLIWEVAAPLWNSWRLSLQVWGESRGGVEEVPCWEEAEAPWMQVMMIATAASSGCKAEPRIATMLVKPAVSTTYRERRYHV
ncbi:hypothetical protein VaNZ11_011860 [Volvox africanus]|uniref:Uncharacterized protein n=1 Tax=Volvox africanus TaxID=51714 RepID=A0ABQ5SD83_9CHLO|nr:hypothetical protein VaNZ11_011860 [Volvox africanus]